MLAERQPKESFWQQTLAEFVQALAQLQQELVAKMTTAAPEPAPVVAEVKVDPLDAVQKQVASLTAELQKVSKSMSGITPVVPARTEGTTPAAPAKKDPNSCFNGLFGIKS